MALAPGKGVLSSKEQQRGCPKREVFNLYF